MKKHLMTLMFLLFSGITQKIDNTRRHYKDITHLRIMMAYLKVIKTTRMLFLSFLGIGICLVFLLSSIVLFHVAVFLYAPLTSDGKMWVSFSCAAIYLLIAAGAFSYIFAQNKWLMIFNADQMLKDLSDKTQPQDVNTESH